METENFNIQTTYPPFTLNLLDALLTTGKNRENSIEIINNIKKLSGVILFEYMRSFEPHSRFGFDIDGNVQEDSTYPKNVISLKDKAFYFF